MKKLLSISLLSFFSAVAIAQSLTPVYKEVDCGEMVFRQPATYLLEFKNTGMQPVTVKSVDTGCGCTTASYTQGQIQPGGLAQVSLTFDCMELGHFSRNIRVFTSLESSGVSNAGNETYTEMLVKGYVVAKKENFSGQYPYKLGNLLADKDYLEFDDVNKGQKLTQEIHIMNPMGQNSQPVLLRLPSYLTAEMTPAVLGPRQNGVMRITLNSNLLRDYGLNQTTVFLAKNNSDKFANDKTIPVSVVLLPPAISKDDVNRPYAAKLSLSKDYIDMTMLKQKSKYSDRIIISNNGRKTLEIQKLQLFATGEQLSLDKQSLQPGENATLEVTCNAKDMKKSRVRPRILMITNDPDHQKVVIEVKE